MFVHVLYKTERIVGTYTQTVFNLMYDNGIGISDSQPSPATKA